MNNQIKKWEIWGAILTILVGSLLHFTFEWSGGSKIVALFSAVNESTWEHLKLAFWPIFIITVIEYFTFGKQIKNFCLAVMVKIYLSLIIIIALFYGWTAILPDSLIWDIFTFILAVIISYFAGYKIMKINKDLGWNKISIVLIIISIICFSLFTYFPPENFLFENPISGGYGIGDL